MSEIMASTSRRLSAGTIDISLLGGRDDAADGVQCKLLHRAVDRRAQHLLLELPVGLDLGSTFTRLLQR
jgi:hypothetical protein